MKTLFFSLVFFITLQNFGQNNRHPIDVKTQKCLIEKVPTTIGAILCEKKALSDWQAEMENVMKLLKAN